MEIYMTRHGETLWNKQRRMQGRKDSLLTEKGKADAKRLKKRLETLNFDGIYASPLGRAMETAEILKGGRALEIQKAPLFMEMSFGQWEGREVTELEEAYGQRYRDFWDAPEKYVPMGGESFSEMLERVDRGLRELEQGIPKEGKVLLVAHAVVIKSIYAVVKNLPPKEFWNPPFMHGTNLSILEIKEGKRKFLLEGDISHLQE